MFASPMMVPSTRSCSSSRQNESFPFCLYNTHQKSSSPRDCKDNSVEPRNLEDRQPCVRRSLENSRQDQDRRDDGQEEVDSVRVAGEESSPVGKVRTDADQDLGVESESNRELHPVREPVRPLAHVVGAVRLEADRDEDQRDPDQASFLVPESDDAGSAAPTARWFPVVIKLLSRLANSTDLASISAFIRKVATRTETYEAAAKAECFVCSRISAKVLESSNRKSASRTRVGSVRELNGPRNHRHQQIEHPGRNTKGERGGA